MFIEKPCKEFLDDLAAKKSVPGGGGAAAFTGALAAALTSMVCNFTVDKKGYEESHNEIKKMLKEAEDIRNQLVDLIEADAQAFSELMAVYKMPKNTEEEKNSRAHTLQEKAKKAADVPMKIAALSLLVQELALKAQQKGNRDLESDAILSGIMGRAALKSAYYNVIINLKIINDYSYKQKHLTLLNEMLEKGGKLEQEIMQAGEKNFTLQQINN